MTPTLTAAGDILQTNPIAAAYAQVITAVITIASFIWASQYARKGGKGNPQRRINKIEDVHGARWVCNPGRRTTDRCASCPLDDTCLKNLPPLTVDESMRDQAAALVLHERVVRLKSRSTVLFVDDNAELGMVVQSLLTSEGITVRLATNIAEAFPVRDFEDLLITDWRLPDGSGNDVLHTFREARPRKPVIVVSALEETPADLPPYVTWVSKPFDPDEFVSLVHNLLRG